MDGLACVALLVQYPSLSNLGGHYQLTSLRKGKGILHVDDSLIREFFFVFLNLKIMIVVVFITLFLIQY